MHDRSGHDNSRPRYRWPGSYSWKRYGSWRLLLLKSILLYAPHGPASIVILDKMRIYSSRTRWYRVPQAGSTPLTANSSSTVTNRTPLGCKRSTISRAAVTLVA